MIVLYTIGCPSCRVLEEKLNKKKIKFSICTDTEKMIELGMTTMPVLEVDGVRMNYNQAFAWVSEQEGHN